MAGMSVGFLSVSPTIRIPDDELVERFVRASGAGGQNVNKVSSAVELRFDVAHSPSLPEAVRERVLARRDRRLTAEGVLVIDAQRFRTQERNRTDARERLQLCRPLRLRASDGQGLKGWRKAADLLEPVVEQRGRRDDEGRPRPRLFAREQESDDLQCLAEAHVVGEDAAEVWSARLESQLKPVT